MKIGATHDELLMLNYNCFSMSALTKDEMYRPLKNTLKNFYVLTKNSCQDLVMFSCSMHKMQSTLEYLQFG